MYSRRALMVGLAALAASPAHADITASLRAINGLGDQFGKDGRYLPVAFGLRESPVRIDDIVEQWAAFIGDEPTALANAARNAGADGPLTAGEPEDAISAILSASRGARVVVLNEAHCASRHRMFLIHLLRALRAEGFTHFAAETFLNSPFRDAPHVEALRPGDRLTIAHGYYTRDPVFAEAVREALELGYQLVAYEARPDQETRRNDTQHVDVGREQGEATNLEAVLASAPKSRVLVYVGYGHINTDLGADGGPRFAGLFEKDTGIRPLTIVQDRTGSFGPHAPDLAFTKRLLRRYAPRSYIADRPSRVEGGWTPDLFVFHPDLPDVHGRPGWLAADEKRRLKTVELPRLIGAGPVLAQAFHFKDDDPAIPADQYLLTPGARGLNFFLRPGRYRIRLETLNELVAIGEVQV